MLPDYISSTFSKLLKKYDLPHVRFHDLRHTAATLMMENGANVVDVKNTLGHSKISITVDWYGQSAKRQASQRTAAIMEEAFSSVENL
jgi:integrase